MIRLPQFLFRFTAKATQPELGTIIQPSADPFGDYQRQADELRRQSKGWRFFRQHRLKRALGTAWRIALVEHERHIDRAVQSAGAKPWITSKPAWWL